MLGLEKIRDPNVFRLYAASLLVGLAYGISLSLTAIHLDAHGFGKEAIGNLAAWFAGGLVLVSLPIGSLIRRFSGKRVLTGALVGYAGAVALFPWVSSYAGLAAVRFVDGACSVAVWVSCETLLLSRAEPDHKASTMSLYTITLALGYILGPILARLVVIVAPLTAAFGVAAAFALLAAGYVALRLEPDSSDAGKGHATSDGASNESGWSILWKIKASCFATFSYGYFQATVVLFLPIYLMESKGILRERTILIPAFFAAGMLLFSNAVGRVGDRVGHLAVMRGLAAVGTSMILGFVFLDAYPLMCAAVFIAGASLATISPISLALQGAQCETSEYSRATAIYNTFYAAGILLGPPIAGRLFARAGGELMLYHLAALWMAFIAFSILFARDDPRARRSLVTPEKERA
jgi:predicted MFS family arabinose efflux permease